MPSKQTAYRCLACNLTFLRITDYQNPASHRCIIQQHPSAWNQRGPK